jgi:hypothetical protein
MLSSGTTLKKKKSTKLLINVATSNPFTATPEKGEIGAFGYLP